MSTSASEASSSPGRIEGVRVLVVEPSPEVALAIAATVAGEGAHATVVRTERAAKIQRGDFEAAVVGCRLGDPWTLAVAERLRVGRRPCLSVTIAFDQPSVDRLLAAGFTEILSRPLAGIPLADAVVRTVHATQRIRGIVPCRGRARARKSPVMSSIDLAVDRMSVNAKLSGRERSVLRLIAMGLRYVEIGQTLAISPRTVKMHAASLRTKTGTPSRSALLRALFSA